MFLDDSLAAEADSRAGEVLVWEEGVRDHLVVWQFSAETLTQGLRKSNKKRVKRDRREEWWKQNKIRVTTMRQHIFIPLLNVYTTKVMVHHLPPERETLSRAGGGSVCECSSLADWRPPAADCSQWGVWWSGCQHTARSWRPPYPGPVRESASGASCPHGRTT